jgi:hypothetical protein
MANLHIIENLKLSDLGYAKDYFTIPKIFSQKEIKFVEHFQNKISNDHIDLLGL